MIYSDLNIFLRVIPNYIFHYFFQNKELNAIKSNITNSSSLTNAIPYNQLHTAAPLLSFGENIENIIQHFSDSLHIDSKCSSTNCTSDLNATLPQPIDFVRRRGYFNDPATGKYDKPIIPPKQFIRSNHTVNKPSESQSTPEGFEVTSPTFYSEDTSNETAFYNESFTEYFITEGQDEFDTSTMEFLSSYVDNSTYVSSIEDFHSEAYSSDTTISSLKEISTNQTVNVTKSSSVFSLLSKALIPSTKPSFFPSTTTFSEGERDRNISTTSQENLIVPGTISVSENRTINVTKNENETKLLISLIETTTKPSVQNTNTPTSFTCRPESTSLIPSMYLKLYLEISF